ncbi:MAG: hypothetical protein HRT61_23220, partial [Ekhidna sp.]|nr:hypothetical protein [Ekhidna sp.]
NRTSNGSIPEALRKNSYYQREKRYLETEFSQFDHFIIDFAKSYEIDFWERYYYDLFVSWGFQFINKNYLSNRTNLLGRYCTTVWGLDTHYRSLNLKNTLEIDSFIRRLNFDLETLKLSKRETVRLIQFEAYFRLSILNLLDHKRLKEIHWRDILNEEKFKLNLIEIPILMSSKSSIERLHRIKGHPHIDTPIFTQNYNLRFPTFFNALMFFYGYSLRIDHPDSSLKKLSAIYLIQKKGFSVDLHSFLSKVLGFDILEDIEIIFEHHLSTDSDNFISNFDLELVFDEAIKENYKPS